jgi:3-hydroxybutyryl-CoA dehydrogenase
MAVTQPDSEKGGQMEKITIIGAGLMGHGIGMIFARKGHPVTLVDIKAEFLDNALASIRDTLANMAEAGIGQADDIDGILDRIDTTTDVKAGVSGAGFVFEAILENLALKQDLFQQIDGYCPPETILASNTSVISITEIAQKSKQRQRIVGTHFWNPPYLIPLVEVIRAADTSDDTMDRAFDLLAQAGKHPVKVLKDVPGFLANRLQHALWREAISIVENGIADAATVDECIKNGFGLRLPALGPMENADMVGTDLTLAIHDYILRDLESSPEPSPLLRKLVEKGNLGFKSGQGFQTWSDEAIAASRKNLQKYLMAVTTK